MNQTELPVETDSHAFHTGHARVPAAIWRRKLLSHLLALRLGLKARFDRRPQSVSNHRVWPKLPPRNGASLNLWRFDGWLLIRFDFADIIPPGCKCVVARAQPVLNDHGLRASPLGRLN